MFLGSPGQARHGVKFVAVRILGCQVVLGTNWHQCAGAALPMKHCTGDRVVPRREGCPIQVNG
jgi:hypothetical protein